MEPKTLAAFLAGAVLAGSTATIAGIDDAKQSIRALAPDVAVHRVDLTVLDDGSVVASIHQHGVLTADAAAAGAQSPGWVVDNVACGAGVVAAIQQQCPIVDESKVPVAFKAPK